MAYLGGRFLKDAPINFNALADNVAVAAVAGAKIKVYRFYLVAAAAVTVTIKDGVGGTALTGPIPLAANQTMQIDINHLLEPAFETSTGNAFVIATASAVQISGKLDYLAVQQ